MKISLITIHSIRHYGSVLQTLATQQLLEDRGHEVEVVDYWRRNFDDSVESHLRRSRWNSHAITRLAYRIARNRGVQRAADLFGRFVDRRINLTSRQYHSPRELMEDPPVAEVYCVGSDQVWNDEYNEDGNGPFYLEYAPSEAMKLSLASSFGKDGVRPQELQRLCSALAGFGAISVREDRARDFLGSVGIDAEQLVDPALAISTQFWLGLAAGETTPSRKYVLSYMLNRSPGHRAILDEAARRTLAEPLHLDYRFHLGHLLSQTAVLPSVERFLALFRDAEAVVTDSFHGLVFSLVFGRRVIVLLPPRYSTRLGSLLRLVGIDDDQARSWSVEEWLDCPLLASGAADVLARERARFGAFLSRALPNA